MLLSSPSLFGVVRVWGRNGLRSGDAATNFVNSAANASAASRADSAGLRVSELTSLTCDSIRIQAGPHVHCTGKGRKERDTPLLPAVVRILKTWLAERDGEPGDPLFPSPSGQRLSRDAVERRVKLYHQRASAAARPWPPST